MSAARGFRWLLADARFTPEEFKQPLLDACHQNGMICGVWEAEVDYGSPGRAAQGYDCYVGQVEGDGQRDRLVQSLPAYRMLFPDLPSAVVTNGGGLDTAEKARPLIAAGFRCIAEGHIKEDGVDPRARAQWCEQVLGFTRVQPMAGLGNGATLADYPDIENSFGWSVFGAERLFSS